MCCVSWYWLAEEMHFFMPCFVLTSFFFSLRCKLNWSFFFLYIQMLLSASLWKLLSPSACAFKNLIFVFNFSPSHFCTMNVCICVCVCVWSCRWYFGLLTFQCETTKLVCDLWFPQCDICRVIVTWWSGHGGHFVLCARPNNCVAGRRLLTLFANNQCICESLAHCMMWLLKHQVGLHTGGRQQNKWKHRIIKYLKDFRR